MERLKRMALAQETLKINEQGYYINAKNEKINIKNALNKACDNTELFEEQDFAAIFEKRDAILAKLPPKNTVFELTTETSLAAAERLSKTEKDIFCLNFASAKNPGGGFLNGSQAQEESLARSSSLYNCLLTQEKMYATNRKLKNCLYTDDMIYAPEVPVLRRDNGDLLDNYYPVSFLTAPAVNAGVVREREPQNISSIDVVMRLRLEKLLSVAVVKGHTVLILGAWGCGVFRNNPTDVAEYFKYHLLEKGIFAQAFDKIVFAVYGSGKETANFAPFYERFSEK